MYTIASLSGDGLVGIPVNCTCEHGGGVRPWVRGGGVFGIVSEQCE